MSTNIPGEESSIKSKLLVHFEEILIPEEERVLKILHDMKKWKYTKDGMSKYNIPSKHFWIDVTTNKFDIEFYSKIAAENGLSIAHYYDISSGNNNSKMITFICDSE